MAMITCDKSPMGWNSFDCYGAFTYEEDFIKNADFMEENLKDLGYIYMVTDAGWFYDFVPESGQKFPQIKHPEGICLDEYGRYVPSKILYPSGFCAMTKYLHDTGLKFGLHLMRGVPRKAVELKLPIKGTPYTCDMIANVNDTCVWCPHTYGIDMTKPGAYEYYKSVIELLEEWKVDFVKYDDITGFPAEIEAVVKAIEAVSRPICLSLSPGNPRDTKEDYINTYHKAKMLRITNDIWDNQVSNERSFERLEQFAKYNKEDFFLDLDMLCLGHLRLNQPTNKDERNTALYGEGSERMCGFSEPQKKTFVTLRAICASPLMIGSDMPTMGEDIKYIINKDMIKCNQETRNFSLIPYSDGFTVWESDAGYVAIFNRKEEKVDFNINFKLLGITKNKAFDVWNKKEIIDNQEISLEANDVLFIKI